MKKHHIFLVLISLTVVSFILGTTALAIPTLDYTEDGDHICCNISPLPCLLKIISSNPTIQLDDPDEYAILASECKATTAGCVTGTCDDQPTTTPCTFTYTDWSACVSGTQSRDAVPAPAGCTGGTPDAVMKNCTSTCTFTYTDWSACAGGTQSRDAVPAPVGCTGGTLDVVTQNCTSMCTFTYTEWSACAGGTQSRDAVPAPVGCTGGTLDAVTKNCTSTTAAGNGEACSVPSSISNCDSGFFCIYVSATENECTAQEDTGGPCGAGFECTTGYCDSGTSLCGLAPAGTTPPPSNPANTGSLAPANTSPAPTTPATQSISLPNPLNITSVNAVIGRIIKYIIGISGSVALAVFVYGGILWIISAGRTAYIDKGKKAIKMSVVGLVIIFTSYIVVKFIIEAIESIG